MESDSVQGHLDLATASLQLIIREEGKVGRRNRQQRMEEAEMSDGLKRSSLTLAAHNMLVVQWM